MFLPPTFNHVPDSAEKLSKVINDFMKSRVFTGHNCNPKNNRGNINGSVDFQEALSIMYVLSARCEPGSSLA